MTSLEDRVRAGFEKQEAMKLLGARLARVDEGVVEIELPFRPELGQQHGFFHAGLLATIADSAGGYAAYTLMPPGSEVLTVEFKVNLLSPASGELAVARGRVERAGGTLTVAEIEVEVVASDGERKRCLTGLQTLIRRSSEDLQASGEDKG